jgi:hypothetical protein
MTYVKAALILALLPASILLTSCAVQDSDSEDAAGEGEHAADDSAAVKGGKGPKGPIVVSPTPTLTEAQIRATHDTVCPQVVEYTACASITVTVANMGATGWTGSAGPAARTVTYNSYYSLTQAQWSAVVSHEMGGHHDAWNELVAKVGPSQAWIDYYDLDYFGELWAEGRYLALKGTTRDLSRVQGKEVYLDCAGPVAHGYTGGYLSGLGFSTLTQQQQFCIGSAQVFTDATTKVRPS